MDRIYGSIVYGDFQEFAGLLVLVAFEIFSNLLDVFDTADPGKGGISSKTEGLGWEGSDYFIHFEF